MAGIQSFEVKSGAEPSLLILGSMPGVASLKAVQYYAHPRNAFWPIMADWYGFAVDLPYEQRLQTLLDAGVALWDVLQRCEREGSLDSAIVTASMQTNPIEQWLSEHTQVQKILLNGGKAEQVFRRHFPQLLHQPELKVLSVPSTSPAYAAMSLAEKTQRWHSALAQ